MEELSLRPSVYLCDLCVENYGLTQRAQRYAEGRRGSATTQTGLQRGEG